MPSSDTMSSKKRELLAYKAKLLQEMRYYDRRIEEVRSSLLKTSFVEDSDSSDSEDEFSLTIDKGPTISQLRQQQSMYRTCLQATQELINLQVLQSEVNVLVDDPVIEGEPPVSEPGTWREVTAECRVDLVPFSITFFVHKPDREFGQLSYRGLRVVPVKTAHEGELNKSVLPTVSRPSDAVEVLKSYACAQRSRRTTLARLADRYHEQLYMEPSPEGGYILKCANLLEVSWTLQNKWSPIAPFHHRMKFDLEYMDESYIKIIAQAHKQLSDPSLETDERTLLLAKIISTCLEAKGPTQELYESMSSDPENAQSLKTRRTTLDQEPDGPAANKKKEKELMAPPKSLPKKTKIKGKENVDDNRKLKRSSDSANNPAKKVRTEMPERFESDKGSKTSDRTKSVATMENTAVVKKVDESKAKQVEKVIASSKNSEGKKIVTENKKDDAVNDGDKEKNIEVGKNTRIQQNKVFKDEVNKIKGVTKSKNVQNGVAVDKVNEKSKRTNDKPSKAIESDEVNYQKDMQAGDVLKTVSVTKKVPKLANSVKNINKYKEKSNTDTEKVKNIATSKNKTESAKNTDNSNNAKQKANSKEDQVKSVATVKNKQPSNNQIKVTNKPANKVNEKNVASANKESIKLKAPKIPTKGNKTNPTDKQKDNISKVNKILNDKTTNKNMTPPNKPTQNLNKIPKTVSTDKIENTIEKAVDKRQSVAVKRKSNMVDTTENVIAKKISKPANPAITENITVKKISKSIANSTEKVKNMVSDNNMQKLTKNITSKVDPKFKTKLIPGAIKTHTGNKKAIGNIEKQNSDVKSKIPQKKLSAISEGTMMKNPLRISPRKIPSKFKTTSDTNNKQKLIQKTTSIPRLLKKPVPKT